MKKIYFSLMLITFFVCQLNAGSFSNVFLSYPDETYTKEQVLQLCNDSYSLPVGTELSMSRDVSDAIGMHHYTYQQFINGVKVEGCYLLLHEKEGHIKSVNGRLLENNDMPTISAKPHLRKKIMQQNSAIKEENIELVIFEYNGKYYTAYKYFDKNKYANIYVDTESGTIIAEISLIYHADANGTAYTYYYGWKNIIYDTTNGLNTLIDNSRNICTADASIFDGVNYNTLSDYTNPSSEWYTPVLTSVTLTWAAQSWWYNALTDSDPDFYIKVKKNGVVVYESEYYDNTNPPITFNIPVTLEADGNISIEVCDYDGVLGSDDSAGSVSITKITAGTYSWNNSKTQATYTISKAPHPALDVHWGMEKVYDFYVAKFNHTSFDGNGGQILQLVNPPSDVSPFADLGYPNNATAFGGLGIMAYGFGDGTDYNPLVTIDVMGHEFTHMVTGANGDQNLPNYGEGGALNESFGDIIGNAIEEYAIGSADWLVATGVSNVTPNHAIRSLSDPKSMGSPNTYKGTYWQNVTGNHTQDNDMDGVHTNCGVQNYWAYLLSYGGSGYIDGNSSKGAYNVVGIGMDKTIQIAYRNLLYYITSSSNYADSRSGAIQAAIDLYGADSQEHQSVANAWHAVGVGSKYVAPQSSITVKAKMPSNWGTTISAWIWEEGSNGSWATLTKDGEWYSYTTTVNPLNIVFVNGYTWNGDSNQSVDISVTENTCIQLNSNGTNKCTYTVVDCPDEDEITPPAPDCKSIPFTETFASSQGDFTIHNVTQPDGLTSIWKWDAQYGMVAKAINGSTKYESEAWLISPCIELPEEQECVLTFSHAAKFFSNTDQMTLYLTTDYIAEAPGESYWEQLTIPTYPTGSNWNWFESGDIDLSAYKGEHIVIGFRYVSDTNYAPQWEIKNFAITQSGTSPVTPPVESNRYIILAQRDASSNWFYMTSDLGSASTKRYQAVDAGTSTLSSVNSSNLDSKFYWEIEDNKLKTAAGYSSWTSGNSANLNATGKDLTIQQQADGTYTFSFADGSDTRYLSLNKTAGNDYFAYYKGMAQVYKLTLVKEGTTTPTSIENTGEESLQNNLVRKVIINNQLFILRDGKTYTVQGQEVK